MSKLIAVALTAFLISLTATTDNLQAAERTLNIPRNVRPSKVELNSTERIASTLQKLSKNLILESTRGERDIALFQKAAPAVVLVFAGKDSVGSGALTGGGGRVVTNWHVVGANPNAVVFLKPKEHKPVSICYPSFCSSCDSKGPVRIIVAASTNSDAARPWCFKWTTSLR